MEPIILFAPKDGYGNSSAQASYKAVLSTTSLHLLVSAIYPASSSKQLTPMIRAPGLIHSPFTSGYVLGSVFPELAKDMTSVSLTSSSTVSTARITGISGYFTFAYSINASRDFCPLPFTLISLISGHSARIAASDVFPITPGPQIPQTAACFGARYRAPTPGIAPVLIALKIFADISAMGAPVSLSFNITVRMERGSPLLLLLLLLPYHFIPARSKEPPI